MVDPTRRTPLSLALVLACCLLASGCGDGAQPERLERAKPLEGAAATEPSAASGGIIVDVAGLVRTPGVYRMPAGARVHDAILAAGGARRGAQLGALNRAAVLVDGQQVMVGAATTTGGAGDGANVGTGPQVSINSADATQLDALPGIGPVTAQRIVDDREAQGPFARVDDLDRVPGIGPATIEALRDLVGT